MAFLELSGLQKFYGANHVVRDFNLDVAQGEFVSFLGPSGCGKTTTLRMVAGFEVPDQGVIRIDGKDVTNLRPNQRKIGMVFQAYALFPEPDRGAERRLRPPHRRLAEGRRRPARRRDAHA